ncbi:MAG: hypothetical protein VB106_09100 [Clostridiaceae bacterium]|nr:hypothetical protein [Clostridiaceae bacterium]
MGFIIGITSTIVVLICVVPIIISAIKAVKYRKNMTKQLLESIYRTSIICSSMIFIFGFIAKVSFKIEPGINSIILLLGDVLLDLIFKLWPFPIAIYIIKNELKKYSD